MKKFYAPRPILALLVFLAVFQTSVNAQTLKDFFSSGSAPTLYLGIDFTKNKVIDDPSASASEIKERYYDAINELVITEAKKFDVKSAFHQSNMDHDLGIVSARNDKINSQDIKSSLSSDFSRLKADSINQLVASYDFGTKTGIGILFVSEAFSKTDKAGAIWVTLIDMKAKKVLLTQRVEGKTGMSFGFRNYWATAVHSVIESIEKKYYKEWKSQYGG
jgi:hypothetical protein